MHAMKFRVKVHKKGLIVIPAEVRRMLGIQEGSYIELLVEGGEAKIIAPKSLLDAFGVDGEKALDVARLIFAERRKEVEEEVRS